MTGRQMPYAVTRHINIPVVLLRRAGDSLRLRNIAAMLRYNCQILARRYIRGRTVLILLTLGIIYVLLRRRAVNYNRIEHPDHGFVLTLEYTGQLIAGLRALLSQQCWLSSFRLPLVIVEPFSNNSLLRHSHRLWRDHSEDHPTVLFRDLFDVDHLNEQSHMTGNPVLSTWENFLRVAPRKVILVTIENIHQAGCLLFQREMCELALHKPDIKLFTGCHMPENSQQAVTYLQKHNFHVVRNVCINCMEAMTYLTPDAVTEHIIGPHDAQGVTVIFNRWRFSMRVTKDCMDMEMCSNEKTVLPQRFVESKRLKRDAAWYRDSYFHSQMFIAIMIRVEWHFITNRKDQHHTNDAMKCLDEVLEAVAEVQKEFCNSNIASFLAMDVGAYGSGTFEHTIRNTNTSISMYTDVLNHTRHFVSELYRDTWTFKDWEESFLTIPSLLIDKGYIATLQRTIASKAACLILMGGGHFQHMALQSYFSLHPAKEEQCVKYVCVAPAFKRLFVVP